MRNGLDRLIHFTAIIGILCIFLEVGVIMVDVVGRYFGHPLFGSHDIVTMVMVIVVASGMALCDRQGGHIGVDLLEKRFSPRLNRVLDIFSALLGSIIFLAIAWTVWESAKISEMLNIRTNLLLWPKAWFQWSLCALSLLTAACMAMRVIELAVFDRDVQSDQVN